MKGRLTAPHTSNTLAARYSRCGNQYQSDAAQLVWLAWLFFFPSRAFNNLFCHKNACSFSPLCGATEIFCSSQENQIAKKFKFSFDSSWAADESRRGGDQLWTQRDSHQPSIAAISTLALWRRGAQPGKIGHGGMLNGQAALPRLKPLPHPAPLHPANLLQQTLVVSLHVTPTGWYMPLWPLKGRWPACWQRSFGFSVWKYKKKGVRTNIWSIP